jgi:AraC-like DNA-binding protein
MPDSAVRSFVDPYEYQTSIRASDTKVFVTAPGKYQANLTRIDLHQLWMQRSWVSLPTVAHSALQKDRRVVFFLADDHQTPLHHSGRELFPSQIMFLSQGAEHYIRASTGYRWGSMSLSPKDLAAAGRALTDCDLGAPATTRQIRPPSHLMARLLRLHEAANHLAVHAPDILSHPEVSRAVEQELVRAMVMCLTNGIEIATMSLALQRVPIMRRFEQILEANPDKPIYLTEICAAIGVAERTLRQHCQEHLGMGPHRYLWLRRMNLARRALAFADPRATTVTVIAHDHGFGELGRFSVAYRRLFGETPSATLRRAPEDRL